MHKPYVDSPVNVSCGTGVKMKKARREQLSADVELFLESGNDIEKIDIGVTNYKHKTLKSRQKEGVKFG